MRLLYSYILIPQTEYHFTIIETSYKMGGPIISAQVCSRWTAITLGFCGDGGFERV